MIVVLGPKTPFPAATQKVLAELVNSDRPPAFLLDNVKVDLATLTAEPAEHGLDELLSRFGLRMRRALIVDAQCATIAVMQARDGMRFQQRVKYPYVLLPDTADARYLIDDASPLPFVAPLEVVDAATAVSLSTCLDSTFHKCPYPLSGRRGPGEDNPFVLYPKAAPEMDCFRIMHGSLRGCGVT